MDWVEKIPDIKGKQFENKILNQLSQIVQQFDSPEPVIPKSNLKQVSFEDAVKELLQLQVKN
jgi:hypothetical protein